MNNFIHCLTLHSVSDEASNVLPSDEASNVLCRNYVSALFQLQDWEEIKEYYKSNMPPWDILIKNFLWGYIYNKHVVKGQHFCPRTPKQIMNAAIQVLIKVKLLKVKDVEDMFPKSRDLTLEYESYMNLKQVS